MQNKSKRFSFSLLFCFIIGVLTAISFVLSFSGAWFTASHSANTDNVSLKFGSVLLGTNFSGESKADMVPTETISYYGATSENDIAYDGTVNAYYRISFIVTNSADVVDANATAFSSYLSFNNVPNTQYNDTTNKCLYGLVAAQGSIPKGSLKFSKEASNELIDKNLKVKFKIDLIQADNLDDIPNINNMSQTSDYQALFTYYDTNIGV